MKTTHLIVLATLTLLTLGSDNRVSAAEDARVAIGAQAKLFMAAMQRGDAAAIAGLFTPEAKLIVSGVDGPVSGREAIEKFWLAGINNGVRALVLATTDLEGEGSLRVETGTYRALGANGAELGHGQYLFVWMKTGHEWQIHRDIGVAGPAQPAATPVPTSDRVGFPANYRSKFKLLGVSGGAEGSTIRSTFGNDLAAAATSAGQLPLPNGSIIVMEFAQPLRDGEEQLLHDSQGQPLKGEIVHIDVMRREKGYGESYGEHRAGEWEFASYRADGSLFTPPVNGAQCAACHHNAGADADYVFRMKSAAAR
jgi:predicted CXXCH cytochrome family protein